MLSSHRMVWAELVMPKAMTVTVRPVRVPLPNLRSATDERKLAMVNMLSQLIQQQREWLADMAGGGRSELDSMVNKLSALAMWYT